MLEVKVQLGRQAGHYGILLSEREKDSAVSTDTKAKVKV